MLERLYATVLLVVQGTLDGSVEASGLKIGLHASVDRRRAVLLKPLPYPDPEGLAIIWTDFGQGQSLPAASGLAARLAAARRRCSGRR